MPQIYSSNSVSIGCSNFRDPVGPEDIAVLFCPNGECRQCGDEPWLQHSTVRRFRRIEVTRDAVHQGQPNAIAITYGVTDEPPTTPGMSHLLSKQTIEQALTFGLALFTWRPLKLRTSPTLRCHAAIQVSAARVRLPARLWLDQHRRMEFSKMLWHT